MTELKRFQLRLAKLHSLPFDFERASVRLLAQHQQPLRRPAPQVELASEWRDPPRLTAWSTPFKLVA